MKRLEAIGLPAALGLVVLLVWTAGVAWTGTKVFPTPLQVAFALGELAARGVLVKYLEIGRAHV